MEYVLAATLLNVLLYIARGRQRRLCGRHKTCKGKCVKNVTETVIDENKIKLLPIFAKDIKDHKFNKTYIDAPNVSTLEPLLRLVIDTDEPLLGRTQMNEELQIEVKDANMYVALNSTDKVQVFDRMCVVPWLPLSFQAPKTSADVPSYLTSIRHHMDAHRESLSLKQLDYLLNQNDAKLVVAITEEMLVFIKKVRNKLRQSVSTRNSQTNQNQATDNLDQTAPTPSSRNQSQAEYQPTTSRESPLKIRILRNARMQPYIYIPRLPRIKQSIYRFPKPINLER